MLKNFEDLLKLCFGYNYFNFRFEFSVIPHLLFCKVKKRRESEKKIIIAVYQYVFKKQKTHSKIGTLLEENYP